MGLACGGARGLREIDSTLTGYTQAHGGGLRAEEAESATSDSLPERQVAAGVHLGDVSAGRRACSTTRTRALASSTVGSSL